MKGHYDRTEYHCTAIAAGISKMTPQERAQHKLNISKSFIDRVPRVYDRDLYDLWNSNRSLGYKKFRKLAIACGFEDKDYVHTIRVYRGLDLKAFGLE